MRLEQQRTVDLFERIVRRRLDDIQNGDNLRTTLECHESENAERVHSH